MKLLIPILAISALGLTVIPAFLVFSGAMQMDVYKTLMTIGTVLWFVTAPIWFRKTKES